MSNSPHFTVRLRQAARVRRFFRALGPGLITGAADDDPSGISTYSVAGAAFGFAHDDYEGGDVAQKIAAMSMPMTPRYRRPSGELMESVSTCSASFGQGSLITLTRGASEDAFWRVNYGTCEINQRGDDFIVDVDAPDGSVLRVLRGQ